MKELIDKISSYSLFNYLFPGVIFVILLRETTDYNLVQENLFTGAFLYYFIGLAISRIGSLVVEWFLKRLSFIQHVVYPKYVRASEQDKQIQLFSEINNMYRTIVSLLLMILLIKAYTVLEFFLAIPRDCTAFLLIVALLVLFLFAYRKQSNYLVKRVESRNET